MVAEKQTTAWLLHASYLLCVYSAIAGGERAFGCAVIWPANALAVTALLLAAQPRWLLHLPLFFGSVTLANLVNGSTLATSLGFASANVLEIAVASALLRESHFLSTGFTRLRSTVSFVLVCGLLAPALGSFVGAATIAVTLGKSPIDAYAAWFTADALGLILIVPTSLALLLPRERRIENTEIAGGLSSHWERHLTLALFLTMAGWVLCQPMAEESFGFRRLHFVVFGMIWLAVRHDSRLTMAANFLVVIVALATVRMGLGPFVSEDTPLTWAVVDAQVFAIVMTTANLLVHAVVDERREALQEANAANRAKSEFLANMSHEIRTPLTAIIGYAELIEHAPPDAGGGDTRQYLRTIRRNGDHLLQIINDILDLSKIEAEQLVIVREPVALCDLLQEVVRLLEARAAEKGIALRLVFRGLAPAFLNTDALRLKQVLINLIGNAIKFTDQGGVEVAVEATRGAGDACVEMRVRDSGIGMTSEQMSRLFQPFTQADASTSRRFGGTGLGLAISQRISRMLGGEIVATSEPGAGSTFTLRLPLNSQEAASLIRPSMTGPSPISKTPGSPRLQRHCHVLLVEDGLDNQRLIRKVLEAAGVTVAIAEDGITACEAVERGDSCPDVILMDMQMPRLDGYGATQRLREGGCKAPIIAITASAMAGDREKCLRVGCDDYLTKPILRDELLAAMERALALDPAPVELDRRAV